jgi:hypothetical protein
MIPDGRGASTAVLESEGLVHGSELDPDSSTCTSWPTAMV